MDKPLDLDFIIKKAEIKPGMIVGEFGCGNGHLSRMLARSVGSTGIVYGVDVMRESLINLEKLANLEGLNNKKTVWSNLELYGATAIRKDTVDIGFIVNTFFQSNQEKDFLDEVLRMIKKNGRVIVVDWKDEAISPIAPKPKDRTGIEKLKKICKELGNVEFSEVSNLGDTHYCAVLTKIK
jgi:cyclopropane fatty-acyl-phospholipid synthase-like methyltransferase